MRTQFFIALDNISLILSATMIIIGFLIGIYLVLKLGLNILRKILRTTKEYWSIAHYFVNKEKYKELIYENWYTIQYYPTDFTDWIVSQNLIGDQYDDSVWYGENLPTNGMIIPKIFEYWKREIESN